jgi:predicted NUDIX family NTP pyrophosphohydrolase
MANPLRSAGLLPFRLRDDLEVLIGHPGGPYFAHRDSGAWSLLKGLVKEGEADEDAAGREFSEETGWAVPETEWIPLGETKMRSRKVVIAWAIESDFDPDRLDPGQFSIGNQLFPEIDRVDWFEPEDARIKLNPAMGVFIDRLKAHVQNRDKTISKE